MLLEFVHLCTSVKKKKKARNNDTKYTETWNAPPARSQMRNKFINSERIRIYLKIFGQRQLNVNGEVLVPSRLLFPVISKWFTCVYFVSSSEQTFKIFDSSAILQRCQCVKFINNSNAILNFDTLLYCIMQKKVRWALH